MTHDQSGASSNRWRSGSRKCLNERGGGCDPSLYLFIFCPKRSIEDSKMAKKQQQKTKIKERDFFV